MILTRLAAKHQDVPLEHRRKRRVEARHLHLRLRRHFQVGIDLEALFHSSGGLLPVFVSHDAANHIDVPVGYLRSG